jgi:hypothetical protein
VPEQGEDLSSYNNDCAYGYFLSITILNTK